MITLDSQAYTYLLSVMRDGVKPTDGLANEKIALIRLFLFTEDGLYLTPTVIREYQAIKDVAWKDWHESNNFILFHNLVIKNDSELIQKRATELLQYHNKENDCRIVAESENGGAEILLTYDTDLRKRLSSKTESLLIELPPIYWNSLNIKKGASPKIIPSKTNPLLINDFWCV